MDAVMAGTPAGEIEALLKDVPSADRQTTMCEMCSLQKELASNCLEYGNEVSALLTSNCPLYVNGVATCLQDLPATVRFEISIRAASNRKSDAD
jgi:hypothetical protein